MKIKNQSPNLQKLGMNLNRLGHAMGKIFSHMLHYKSETTKQNWRFIYFILFIEFVTSIP